MNSNFTTKNLKTLNPGLKMKYIQTEQMLFGIVKSVLLK